MIRDAVKSLRQIKNLFTKTCKSINGFYPVKSFYPVKCFLYRVKTYYLVETIALHFSLRKVKGFFT